MNFKEFKAGTYRKQYQYHCFVPALINHGWSWDDPKIDTLLEDARGALGELNAYTRIVPEVDMFIHMHVLKEAMESSRIEGTRTEMDEALMEREDVQPERRNDWQEVWNYTDAMNNAVQELAQIPLSVRLLRQTHAILMRGVRGEHKQPGELRKSQNWIGGSSPGNAAFVPPSHEEVPLLMQDLEIFWHNEDIAVPHLIRIAISHYQFETIHPFLDGNGRIGRLLITLYLISHGLLERPSLYLSEYLERHKTEYYNALTTVRTTNDIAHWVRFFLGAVLETAQTATRAFGATLTLRDEMEEAMGALGRRRHNGQRFLQYLYRQPLVTAPHLSRDLAISLPTAYSLISDFEKLGILKEVTGYSRNRMYSFTRYLQLFT